MNNLFLLSAEEYADVIQECLAKKGVKVRLEVINDREPRYVFRVIMSKTARAATLRNCIEDLKLYLEVPNVDIIDKDRALYLVVFTERIESPKLTKVLRRNDVFEKFTIAHPIGVDDTGHPIVGDLVEYPHLMISGTTKSGKSVALECLLLSLLQYSPEYVNLIICDQTVGLSQFSDLPHLSCPVVQDNETFIKVIMLLKEEMERRIQLEGTDEYNVLPYIVCVVDEFPAFVSMKDLRKNQLVVDALQSILRRGRHGRIHLVLAANDPKKENVKIDVSDIPAKMAFRTANFHNSVTAIGSGGAEQLKGRGEMYFSNGEQKHLQGFYISPNELTMILLSLRLSYLSEQYTLEPGFYISDTDLMRADNEINNTANSYNKIQDALLPSIIVWALEQNEVSCNAIKNHFNIGWNRASRIMNELTELEIVCEPSSTSPRKVILRKFDEIPPNAQELLKQSGYVKCEEEVLNNEYAPIFNRTLKKPIKKRIRKDLKYISYK